MSQGHRIRDPRHAKDFMLAGNAHLTLVSTKTGQRFTYRVRAPKQKGSVSHFVSVLYGPNNQTDYAYLGHVFSGQGGHRFVHGKKSRYNWGEPQVKAFKWFWEQLVGKGELPESVELWHEGHCGRCHRPLTVPLSIERGIGPECWGKGGFGVVHGFVADDPNEVEWRAYVEEGEAHERAMMKMEAEGDRLQTIRDERNKHEARTAMEGGFRRSFRPETRGQRQARVTAPYRDAVLNDRLDDLFAI